MNVLLIGFGQAGGTIVDEFLRYERASDRSFVGGTLAVDTAKEDLMGLERVPNSNRVLIGQSRVKGHGVGADHELGAEIAEDDLDEIQGGLDSLSTREIDAFVIVAGLGGGTGSGGAPILAKHLKGIYVQPVYGIGVLPASDEGGIYTLNAARSVRPFAREVDNLFLFDNDAWRDSADAGDYGTINEEIVRRFVAVLSVPDDERDGIADSTDVMETLDTGGITSIGFAAEEIERSSSGLLSSLTGGGDDPEVSDAQKTNRITSQVRKAALGQLTLPAEIESAGRAFVSVAGPRDHLTQKGVERGRKWLEEQTGADRVHGGTRPLDVDYVAATVALSGLETIPRLDELDQVAREAEEQFEEMETSDPDPDSEESLFSPSESASDPAGTSEAAAAGGDTATDTESPSGGETTSARDRSTEPASESPDSTTTTSAEASEEPDTSVDPSVSEASAEPDASSGDSVSETSEMAGSETTEDETAETEPEPTDRAQERDATDFDADGRIPAEIPSTRSREFSYDDIEIGDLIGGGGNADVHEARAPGGERLAVKLPRFDGTLHTDDIERVLDEAETWSKLDDHDHIVDVVDYGDAPRPWIAMEYMDGGTLADRIDELDFAEAAWIAARISAAIEHAHRRGVAHLDLKPENVLFRSTPGDDFDVPKVADWGLSKHLLEHSGSIDGLSTQYAAPEQFDSDTYGDSSDRTDVYQLGAIVYELFAGRPPFEGSAASVMNSVLNDEPEAPTQHDLSLPDAVDEVVLKALEPEQTDRYDHVVLFRRRLEELAPRRAE